MTGIRSIPGPPSETSGGNVADLGASGLLAYGANTTIALIDTRSCQHVKALTGLHSYPVTNVAFDPTPSTREVATPVEGPLLVSGDSSGVAVLWDVNANRGQRLMQKAHNPISGLAWAGGGLRRLVVASEMSIIVLEVPSGNVAWKSDRLSEPPASVATTPHDMNLVAIGGKRGGLMTLAMGKLKTSNGPLSQFEVGGTKSAIMCSFCEDWQLVTMLLPRALLMFDLVHGAPLAQGQLQKGVSAFSCLVQRSDKVDSVMCIHANSSLTKWHRDGKDGSLKLQKHLSLSPASLSSRCSRSKIVHAALLPHWQRERRDSKMNEGELLVALFSDSRVVQYRIEGDRANALRSCEAVSSDINSLSPIPADGTDDDISNLAIATTRGSVDILDVHSNSVALSYQIGNAQVKAVAWLSKSSVAALTVEELGSGKSKNSLSLIGLESGHVRSMRRKGGEASAGAALEASSSGKLLAVTFSGVFLELWDVSTYEPSLLRVLTVPVCFILSIDKAQAHGYGEEKRGRESFGFCLSNGLFGVLHSSGKHLKLQKPSLSHDSTLNEISDASAFAVSGAWLIFGDTHGRMYTWSSETEQTSSFSTGTDSSIVSISPLVQSSGRHSPGNAALLLSKGQCHITDLSKGTSVFRVSSSLKLKGIQFLRGCDNGMLASYDAKGSVHIFNIGELKRRRTIERDGQQRLERSQIARPEPLSTPVLLPRTLAMVLKISLQRCAPSSVYLPKQTQKEGGGGKDSKKAFEAFKADQSGRFREFGISDHTDEEVLRWLPTSMKGQAMHLAPHAAKRASAIRKALESLVASDVFDESIFDSFSTAHGDTRTDTQQAGGLVQEKGETEEAMFIAQRNELCSRVFGEELEADFWARVGQQVGKGKERTDSAQTGVKRRSKWRAAANVDKSQPELIALDELSQAAILQTPKEVVEGRNEWRQEFYRNSLQAVALASATGTGAEREEETNQGRQTEEEEGREQRGTLRATMETVGNMAKEKGDALTAMCMYASSSNMEKAGEVMQAQGRWEEAGAVAERSLDDKAMRMNFERWAEHSGEQNGDTLGCALLYIQAGSWQRAIEYLASSKLSDVAFSLCGVWKCVGCGYSEEAATRARDALGLLVDELVSQIGGL